MQGHFNHDSKRTFVKAPFDGTVLGGKAYQKGELITVEGGERLVFYRSEDAIAND